MNKGLISGLVLLVIGLICGLLLSVVNYFTIDKITEVENQIKYAVLEEFYTLADYDISEVNDSGNFGTIFILKTKGTNEIAALVYTVRSDGYADKVEMLIAVEKNLNVTAYKVVSHQESPGYGADIVNNDFQVTKIDDLSKFDTIAGVTKTSDAIKNCFVLIAARIQADLGGGLGE